MKIWFFAHLFVPLTVVLGTHVRKNSNKIWFFAHLFVPLQPLFGVIAGRKFRVACYVALERYNKFNLKSNNGFN